MAHVITKPHWPPPPPPPPSDPPEDPPVEPDEYYKYQASVSLPPGEAGSICVKEVEVTGISSIADNTVKVKLDDTEYSDVPVWIHTDYGTRRRYLLEEAAEDPEEHFEAEDPAEYFERAATIFPIQGGVRCYRIYGSFISKVPKALALVKIDPVTLEVSVTAVVSALQSIEKTREPGSDCFPTWKLYGYIIFEISLAEGEAGEVFVGNPPVADDDGTPYYKDKQYRVILWDFLDKKVARIPNDARDGWVDADVVVTSESAATAIQSFRLSGGLLYGINWYDTPGSYSSPSFPVSTPHPWWVDCIQVPSEYQTYKNISGTLSEPAWAGGSCSGPYAEITVDFASAWVPTSLTYFDDVTGEYTFQWQPESYGYSNTTNIDRWSTSAIECWFDGNNYPYDNPFFSPGVNIINTFSFGEKTYSLARLISDQSLYRQLLDDSERHIHIESSIIYTALVDEDTLQVVKSTEIPIDFNSNTWEPPGNRMLLRLAGNRYPILREVDCFLVGDNIIGSHSSAIGRVSFNCSDWTWPPSISGVSQSTSYDWFNFGLSPDGKEDYFTPLAEFLDSVFGDFSQHDDSLNNWILIQSWMLNPPRPDNVYFTPDSMRLTKLNFNLIAYNINDAFIPPDEG